MTSISVYEPVGCCSSGVCGPEVEESMAGFAAALTEEEAAAASLAGVILNLSDGLGAKDARGVFALERIAKGPQRAVAAAVVVELAKLHGMSE